MVSHIYLALGMWDEVASANEQASRVVADSRRVAGLPPAPCGHYTEWLAPAIYCDNCEVYWTDAAQIERDRRDLANHEAHDEHTDAYMFDRSLRNIGGMLR